VEFSSLIETVGVVFGIAGVWLTIRQHVWCWPVGIVSVALFAVVFFNARLYGSASLQLGYVAISLYGWHAWRHPREGRRELPVTKTPVRMMWALGATAAAGTALLGVFLRDRTDAVWPLVDAGTTSFSLAAQFMTTRKWIETWTVWIAVDVIYVVMYVSQGLVQAAGLYAVFLALAVLGHREWRASMTREIERLACSSATGSPGERAAS
jgi:nicotinamide mononucleotide transporter